MGAWMVALAGILASTVLGENVSALSTVTFTGRVIDAAGAPMPGVQVELYDVDGSTQQYLATAYTGSDGRYTISVTCEQDPGTGASARIDPRIWHRLSNSYFSFYMDASPWPYEMGMNYGTDVACATNDEGDLTWFGQEGLAWNQMHRARNYAMAYVDHTYAPLLKVVVPAACPGHPEAAGCFSPSEQKIYLTAGSSADTAYHEYGHYVHDLEGTMPGLGGHSTCTTTPPNRGDAFTEGWADFFSFLVGGNRFKLSCSVPAGQPGDQYEDNVFQIMYDTCDPLPGCNFGFDWDDYDPVADPSAAGRWFDCLWGSTPNLAACKGFFGIFPRSFTVAAKNNGLDVDTAPSVQDFKYEYVWRGYSVYSGARSYDPDTYVSSTTFWLDVGSGCQGAKTITSPGQDPWHYVTLTAPSGVETSSARVCAQPKDELQLAGPQAFSAPTFKVDTRAPTSTATVSHPLGSVTWTVGWNANDGGSGVSEVQVYEQRPFSTAWTLIHTSASASGSITRTSQTGALPGTYCYMTTAKDALGNQESTGPAEACSGLA